MGFAYQIDIAMERPPSRGGPWRWRSIVGFRLVRRAVFSGWFWRDRQAATQFGSGGIALALIVRPLIQKPGMDVFYARFL